MLKQLIQHGLCNGRILIELVNINLCDSPATSCLGDKTPQGTAVPFRVVKGSIDECTVDLEVTCIEIVCFKRHLFLEVPELNVA